MSKILIVLPLMLAAAVCAADDTDPRSDRELRSELRHLTREVDKQEDLVVKLERAGRSSSNADRSRVIEKLIDHMMDCVVRRENLLGQEHTIKQHGTTVTSGTTDAAEVGTPMPSKKTRRRVRAGQAEEMPDALRRLTRLQTIVVGFGRRAQPAIERQGDAFEGVSGSAREFGDIIGMELAIVQHELGKRDQAAAAADSARGLHD